MFNLLEISVSECEHERFSIQRKFAEICTVIDVWAHMSSFLQILERMKIPQYYLIVSQYSISATNCRHSFSPSFPTILRTTQRIVVF